jgi:pSer/pThr/pTyr-binding forkhead associated (FHA) protein
MQVKLKVARGANAGQEIAIPTARFLVGRGEECHLRPRSDAVSRRHCALMVEETRVTVHDFGSKNGTYVNGERVEGSRVVENGDQIHIGPLQFELVVDHVLGGSKRPVAKDMKEVAARTALSSADDLDIAKWLEDGADEAASRAVAEPDTRQFRVDDTSTLAMDTKVDAATPESEETEAEEGEQKEGKRLKKDKAKLPFSQQQMSAKDSREAAADMLKRFFNRR